MLRYMTCIFVICEMNTAVFYIQAHDHLCQHIYIYRYTVYFIFVLIVKFLVLLVSLVAGP